MVSQFSAETIASAYQLVSYFFTAVAALVSMVLLARG
jgi:hypothetical protein